MNKYEKEYFDNIMDGVKDSCTKGMTPSVQTHVHEFLGSTQLAVQGELRHNHRFAGVTSEEIPKGDSHVHAILVNTDFFFNHFHELGVETGPAIPVGNDDLMKQNRKSYLIDTVIVDKTKHRAV